MREAEFSVWRVLSQADYVRDLMSNFGYNVQDAECETGRVVAKALAQGIDTPDNHFRVCERDDVTIGYLWFCIEDGAAYLMDLLLLPAHQGRGSGKQIIHSLLAELEAFCVSEVELRVAPDNTRAIKLYEQCGFRITGLNMHFRLS